MVRIRCFPGGLRRENGSLRRRVKRLSAKPPLAPGRTPATLDGVTEIENQLLATLLELETAVRDMATANPKPSLLPLFERLESLARQLPPGTDPELLHFLQRKSYEKARQRLQGLATTRGACGH
jgi:hypothetical protein